MKFYDYHCHNGYSRCVKRPWNILDGWKTAKSKGIKRLGITNHVHFNSPTQDYLFQLRERINEIDDPNLLLGVELDIDSPEGKNVLNKQTFEILDYVIGAPHNQPTGFLLNEYVEEEDIRCYFSDLRDVLISSLKTIPLTVWVHPFLQEVGQLKGKYWKEYLNPIYLECLDICAKKGIAIELTPQYFGVYKVNQSFVWSPELKINKDQFNIVSEIYSIAAKNPEIKFSIGSDAHDINDVGEIQIPQFFIKKENISDKRVIEIERKANL